MKLPPLGFQVFENMPPIENLSLFMAFVEEWNASHSSKFTKEEYGEWRLLLLNGIHDAELPIINKALLELKEKMNLVWYSGVSDERTDEDHERSSFVSFVSGGYPDGFYVNAEEAFVYDDLCDHCGRRAPYCGQYVESPVIDESYLDGKNDVTEKYGPDGLDFINILHGGLLISKKTKEVLESLKATGYVLKPVISKATGKASERIFLLEAIKAILEPCSEHTPRVKDAICKHCGSHNGLVGGYVHVQNLQLKGDEVFSLNRYRCTGFYFSQRLYREFKRQNLNIMLGITGIPMCVH